MHQQYETPAAVVATVRRLWQPTFDAMASPLSAICSEYATIEDDILSLQLADRVIYANPAYAMADVKNGAAGIEPHLAKLIDGDVRQRGCTLVALLPNLSHTGWYARLVDTCHEVHHVHGELLFTNPFRDLTPPSRGYLWQCRSYVVCVWRPGAPPAQPLWRRLEVDALPPEHSSRRLLLRRCGLCGRARVLPRYADESAAPADGFECAQSPDGRYNSCSAPEFVPVCVE